MLQTIYSIGREISNGRDEWADIIEPPKTDSKDDSRTLYALNLHFDLDKHEIVATKEQLEPFENDFEKLKDWRSLKVAGGNNKAIYVAVDASKLDLLAKTLFGKPNDEGEYPTSGEFIEAIAKEAPEIDEQPLGEMLMKIPILRSAFFELFAENSGKDGKVKCSLKKFNETYNLSASEKIVLVYASVTSKEDGIENIPIGHLEGYEKFIQKKFFSNTITDTNSSASEATLKLCYATGESLQDVGEAEFSGRYNINKYFQNTNLNFVSNFDKSNFHSSYQVSGEVVKYLDRGADYLLKNMICDIADVRHVVIPQFFNQESFKAKRMSPINEQSDLLFKLSQLDRVDTFLGNNSDIEDLYWLTFMGIDSDGNYFKVGDLIKDIPSFHFRSIQEKLKNSGELLSPWLGSKYAFNLYTIYKAIPVRKDKGNVNKALLLFAAILEQRKIEKAHLFKHFSELMLCHWFERYRAYTNIQISSREKFDFTIKDSVFKYLGFFKALQSLQLLKENLFNMEPATTKTNPAESVDSFFTSMGYNAEQKSLFYLGRVLNRVVREQTGVKKHKKNALDKLNYNGMDKHAIYRFANELFEAGRHNDISEFIKKDWGQFGELFDFNNWKMAPQEALFFILTGYTYYIKSEKPQDTDSITSTSNN